MTSKTIINFPKLHDGQLEVANHPARFRILAAGRRWGKSRLGSALCVAEALRGGRAWWVAPSYPVANVGWRMIKKLATPIPGAEVRLVDRSVIFANGGEVRVRSADNPDSLRGEGLDLVVLDECAFMKQDAWTEALRPSLSDRQGRGVFISTPKGRGWFWSLYQSGIGQSNNEFYSWQLPTSTNPYIAKSEIEAARMMLPERIFQQEYLASFLEDGGGTFRRIMESATATELDAPIPGRQYIAGVDVASKVDFTVVSVFDAASQEQVYLDRFNRVEYPVLEDRLHALYKRFNMTAMTVEDNSIGQGVIDHLRQRSMNIIGFHTSNTTKQIIIQQLAAAFEHGDIKILPDPIQVGELQAYEGKRTPNGSFGYSAPDGLHDDTVMAMAIAWNGLSTPPPAGHIISDIDNSVYKSKRRKSIWE